MFAIGLAVTIRVPLMNLSHGLLAAACLFALALKSNFEAVERAGRTRAACALGSLAWFRSVISVVAGVGLAPMRGREVPLPSPELHLKVRDRFALVFLFAAYMTIAILSFLVLRPA